MGNAQGQIYNAYVNKTPLIITAGNQRRNMQNQYCLLTNHEPTTVPKPFIKWAADPPSRVNPRGAGACHPPCHHAADGAGVRLAADG